MNEIEEVSKLYPNSKSYTDFYNDNNVLYDKTLLAHCIHLDTNELKIIKQKGCVPIHCPTSNIALKSGRMPIEKFKKLKIDFCLGTDIGAGPNLSMFDVMREMKRVHKKYLDISATEIFYRATISGQKVLLGKDFNKIRDEANFILLKIEAKHFSENPEKMLSNIIDYYDNEDILLTCAKGFILSSNNLS